MLTRTKTPIKMILKINQIIKDMKSTVVDLKVNDNRAKEAETDRSAASSASKKLILALIALA